MNHIIMTLGGPNDDRGHLSRIALDRLECTYSLYTNNNNTRILCTGGFGDSFNRTPHPHAYYAKQYLMQRGVKEEDFLQFTLSTNTVEDFQDIESDNREGTTRHLVGSDFRLPHEAGEGVARHHYEIPFYRFRACQIKLDPVGVSPSPRPRETGNRDAEEK